MSYILGAFRYLFKFFFVLAVLLLVFTVIVIAMTMNFDINKHKDTIQEAFNRETGLELLLNGPIQAEYFPEPNVHFSRVEITNRSKGSKFKLNIDDAEVNINFFSLFGDIIKVNSFNARDVDIQLIDGQNTKLDFKIDSFSGQVLSSYREISIPTFTLKSGNNEVIGDFKLMLLSQYPIVNGNFSSRQFNIDVNDPKLPLPGKLFSSKSFAMEWIDNLTGEINWHFDNLFIGVLSIEDTDIQVTFKDKILEMVPRGKVASGDLSGKIQVQKRDNDFVITSQLQIKNGIASEFFQQFWKNAALLNGKLDIEFDGKMRGTNLASWMSHLTGRMLLSIKNMQIQDRDIDSRYVDVFAALWKSLNPSKKGTSLECVAMLLKAEDGQVKAKETIAMQTGDIYALGGGGLDLKKETVDLTFDLYPRSQLNIGVGSIDQVIHLRGSLSKPEFVMSPKGFIKEGGSLLTGIATSGVSILAQKMLKIVNQKSSPCQQVMAEAFEETND
ncbi:MAG: AsmA family protein [Candidatus Berkiella sp.]